MASHPSPLEEAELRFRLAASRLPMVMWTTDADLRFTWGLGAALGALHMDERAFTGRGVADLFPSDEGDSVPVAEHRRALAGHSTRFEFEWFGRWFDTYLEPLRSEAGTVTGVIGVAIDFTDRKKAEDALRRSEDRFQLLGRATSDMAWDWDLETDSIWRNENLLTVFGYAAEDMEPAGSWWEQHIHPEDRDRVIHGLHEAIRSGERFWSAEYRWQKKDGTYASVLDRGYVIHDDQGKPVRMVGSTMDITRRHREEQIREALYRISEAGATARDLPAFYEAVHKIVGTLMPAQNFYIALYDAETDLLSFPYFVDEEESAPEPYKAGRGLTEYVLRSGKPFYASTEGYERLVASGEVVRIGPMSIDWVGVPLITGGRTIGVLVIQTYTEGVRYGDEERDVLSYVSEQIAMAIERKRAEEAHRASEEHYRMLFESNPTPMWVYDLETLRFLAVNDVAVEHYGYTRPEFLSMSIRDIRPPETVEALVASVREPRDQISYSGIWKHRTKGGRLLDAQITSHTLTWDGRPAVLVMAADVTERVREHEALVAAEQKFRSLVEQSLMGIYIIQDNRLIYVNPKFAEVFGYTPEEIEGMSQAADLVAPTDREPLQAAIRRRISGDESATPYSFTGLRKDGSEVQLEVHGSRADLDGRPAIIGALVDVTEQRKAEDALRRSELRFRTLFEAGADAILLVNENGVILDANPAAEAIAHLSRKDLLGRIIGRFLIEEDVERSRVYLRNLFRGESPPEPFEVSIRLASGMVRALSVRSRLVSEEGSKPYAEMIVRDVTEQHEMQRRLVASERLASVGQMAAYIAHEINTPLANISLLAAASKRRTRDAEILARLDKIDAQRRQAASIISDLLSFTKHREIQPADVDMRALLVAAVDQIEPYRRKEVELVTELGDRPVPAHVDPVQMQEVFVNLLRNAFEATAHGSVTLRLEVHPGYRIVSIADTGHGIPEDVQTRLFQPFVSTKRHKGGTGLGLALCRNIVTAHGGEIHFTTALGKGTTFTIVLPQGNA